MLSRISSPSLRILHAVLLMLSVAVSQVHAQLQQSPTVRANDQYGDPLPQGATQRFGSTRFRSSGLEDLTYSLDGKYIAGRIHNGVRIWEADSGQEVTTLGRSEERGNIVFLGAAGDRLAIGGSVPRIWDLTTRKPYEMLSKNQRLRNSIFSMDGKLVAGVDEEQKLSLFDAKTGTRIRDLKGHENAPDKPTPTIFRYAFSPDGKMLASTALNDRVARVLVWDVKSGVLLQALSCSGRCGYSLGFSPSGNQLAFVSGGEIRIVDTASWKEVTKFAQKIGEVLNVAFSPDGSSLAIASNRLLQSGEENKDAEGCTVRILDLKRGTVRRFVTSERWTNAIAFSPDGNTVAAGGGGGNVIHQFDLARGKEKFDLSGHALGVETLDISPDGKTIASSGIDKFLQFWDLKSGRRISALNQECRARLVGFSHDGTEVVLESMSEYIGTAGRLSVYNWRSEKETRRLADGERSHAGAILLADRRTVLLRNGEFLNILNGATVRQKTKVKDRLMISPDGTKLAARIGAAAGIFDVATEKEICRTDSHELPPKPISRIDRFVLCATFSPDGNRIVTGGSDYAAMISEAATGKRFRSLKGHQNHVGIALFSPDGRAVVTACPYGFGPFDRSIRIWEVATGKERRRYLGHDGSVTCIASTDAGRTILSGGDDGTILAWNSWLTADERIKASGPKLWWKLLASEDATIAYDAICAWAESGDVEFLSSAVKPAPLVDRSKIDQLVADLDSANFGKRQKAEQALEEIAESAKVTLREIAKQSEVLEVRRRLESIVSKVDESIPSPMVLQTIRAIEVLERVGSPEARQILRRLAAGAPHASVTLEAAQSLQRLESRR
jgi:WD40 repeat protein